MIPSFFPKSSLEFVISLDFTLLSLDFLPIKDIPSIGEVPNLISLPQPDPYLEEIGLTSESCFVNHVPMVFSLIVIV